MDPNEENANTTWESFLEDSDPLQTSGFVGPCWSSKDIMTDWPSSHSGAMRTPDRLVLPPEAPGGFQAPPTAPVWSRNSHNDQVRPADHIDVQRSYLLTGLWGIRNPLVCHLPLRGAPTPGSSTVSSTGNTGSANKGYSYGQNLADMTAVYNDVI